MVSYRFINSNLVQRDDHVIAWNATDNVPVHPDELQMWKAAGSPKPEGTPATTPTAARPSQFLMPTPSIPTGAPIAIASYPGRLIHDDTYVGLDQIKADLPQCNDIESLKQQVAALADAVQSLLERPPNNNQATT